MGRERKIIGVIGTIIGAACLLAVPGCQMVGYLGSAVSSDEVEAKYKVPPTSLLVIVESYQEPRLNEPSAQLELLVVDQLKEHKVAPVMDPAMLARLRASRGTNFASMTIRDVGKELGAKQVLYVDLRQCLVEGVEAAEVYRGHADAGVKVVDVASGETRWPTDRDDFAVKTETKYMNVEKVGSPAGLEQSMLRDLSLQIGLLFYPHEPTRAEQDAADEPE